MTDRATALASLLLALLIALASLALAKASSSHPSPSDPGKKPHEASQTEPNSSQTDSSPPITSLEMGEPGRPGETEEPGKLDSPRIPEPGDLLLTEIMPDPACVPDADGEWIELYNPTSHSLLLSGLSVGGRKDRTSPLPMDTQVLSPGAYILVGRSEAGGASGAPLDAVVPRLVLGNRNGRVGIYRGDVEISALAYGEDVGLPVMKGRSLALDPQSYPGEGEMRWCLGSAKSRGPCGDVGSPGKVAPPCPRNRNQARRK